MADPNNIIGRTTMASASVNQDPNEYEDDSVEPVHRTGSIEDLPQMIESDKIDKLSPTNQIRGAKHQSVAIAPNKNQDLIAGMPSFHA